MCCSHLWLPSQACFSSVSLALSPGLTVETVCRLVVHDCLEQLAIKKGRGFTHGLCHSNDSSDQVASKVPSITTICVAFFAFCLQIMLEVDFGIGDSLKLR